MAKLIKVDENENVDKRQEIVFQPAKITKECIYHMKAINNIKSK